MLTATDADGKTTTNTYTSWGALATQTDANGKVTTYHYDPDTKLLTSISHDGSTLGTTTYDDKQRVKTTTDAAGLTVTYDYDDADRVIKTSYPDGTHEDVSYASCCGAMGDKPGAVTDRAGRTTEYDYDAAGRVTRVTDSAGNSVNYSYDTGGQLLQLKDTKNNSTTFEYTADGQVSKKTYADGTYESFVYDTTGQLISHRDAAGNMVSYQYDAAGRVTKLDYPHDADVTYSYDALGRVSTTTDGLGTSTYGYDNVGRVTSIDGPWDNDTITYSYDALGRRTALGVNGTTQASYAYDTLDRLTQVTSGASNFDYAYNGASSQLDELTLPTGAKTEYSYDAMERLTSVQNEKADNSNIAQFDYAYNTRDVRTSVEKTMGASTQTINYTYDNTDQLTKELSTEQNPALNKEYSYDAMGNRITSSAAGTSTSYTANNLNQVTQLTQGATTTSVSYDANGNTTAIGDKTFGYNDADQLTSVVVPGEKKSEFVYDSSGLKRISKEYTWDAAANNGAGGWTQSDETRFVYDGMDLIQERGADGTVKASYVRDGNIGGVLSMTNADGTFYYHYDGSGNVTSMTDANQNVVAQYSYDAFGNLLSSSGSEADKNPFRYSSKYYDDDTGLYDYGARFYDSSLGRWINRDPKTEAGGLNLYGFVGNNPINAVDESGYDWMFNINGKAIIVNGFSIWGGGVNIMSGDSAEQALLKDAFERILSTPIGQKMLRRIRSDKKPIWVHVGNYGNPSGETTQTPKGKDVAARSGPWPWQYEHLISYVDDPCGKGRGNEIFINPMLNLNLNTAAGSQPVPLDVQIAHEMGHAVFGMGDNGRGMMNNVNLSENPYRAERRAQLRKAGAGSNILNLYSARTSYP